MQFPTCSFLKQRSFKSSRKQHANFDCSNFHECLVRKLLTSQVYRNTWRTCLHKRIQGILKNRHRSWILGLLKPFTELRNGRAWKRTLLELLCVRKLLTSQVYRNTWRTCLHKRLQAIRQIGIGHGYLVLSPSLNCEMEGLENRTLLGRSRTKVAISQALNWKYVCEQGTFDWFKWLNRIAHWFMAVNNPSNWLWWLLHKSRKAINSWSPSRSGNAICGPTYNLFFSEDWMLQFEFQLCFLIIQQKQMWFLFAYAPQVHIRKVNLELQWPLAVQ